MASPTGTFDTGNTLHDAQCLVTILDFHSSFAGKHTPLSLDRLMTKLLRYDYYSQRLATASDGVSQMKYSIV